MQLYFNAQSGEPSSKIIQRYEPFTLRAAASSSMPSRLKTLLYIPVIIALLMTSFARNLVWHSGPVLWNDIVKKSPNDRRAYSNLCTYYSAEQNFVLGFEICSKALSINPQMPDKNVVNAYINRGALYFSSGDFTMAIQDYQSALALDPTNFRIYNNLGNAHIMQGNINDARKSFDRAISVNPQYALAYSNRGSLNRRMRDYSRAIDDFSMAISLSPENSKARIQRGLTYYDIRQTDKALADFRTACTMGNSEGCGLLTTYAR